MSQTPSEIVENDVDLVLASEHLREIRHSYDSWVIRSYVWARFVIIHIDILELLDRLAPKRGKILDMGCGFGLFSLFLAMRSPERSIYGVDLSENRIQAARRCAEKMRLDNVQFEQADICDYAVGGDWDGIFTLDLLHHVRPQSRQDFLRTARDHLKPDGVLLIKDITTRPWWKMAFTWILDQAMSGPCHVWYQSVENQTEELERFGFEVRSRSFKDRLPYPHVVFHCKPRKES
ncbi:MAG: class I SAM-dependent methyltransferase [Candidatus Omnitrophica bacterium]|nr:class I SAM-dependent methyltransferase [Candidatus Omnitrophota bacterium]MCB9768206.1 class I SAM-dependent methyltransferase [Candidatus Omnitrophota bacterium]